MKNISFTLLFSLIFLLTHAQIKMDSLLKAAATSKTDTGRVFTYERLAVNLMYTSTDSALNYVQKAYALAHKINFKVGEAQSLAIIGNIYLLKGLYPKCIESHLKAIRVYEELNDSRGIAAAFTSIALVYEREEKYTKSLENYFKAKNIFEKIRVSTKSMKLLTRMNDELLITLNNIGADYKNINKLDSALFFLNDAYDLAIKINDQITIGSILSNIGDVQMKRHRYDEALRYYIASLRYSAFIEDNEALAEVNYSIATVKQLKGEVDSALFYARRSYTNAKLDGYLGGEENTSLLLSELYEAVHQSDSALKFFKISTKIKDSISGNDVLRKLQEMDYNEQLLQQEKKSAEQQYSNNLRMYLLGGVLFFVIFLAAFLFRNNRQKQKANLLLKAEKDKTEQAFKELKSTQAQLIQSEKMASLGELTAGIAHEIQNPLNFINNFSEVNRELIEEMKDEIAKGNFEEVKVIVSDLEENEQKILHHGKRADSIVKGMLQHSRAGTGKKELVDINALAGEYLRLSYQAIRSKDKSFNAIMETHFDNSIGKINIVPQDIGRVLLNLFNNAFYAVSEKMKHSDKTYEPTVQVTTKMMEGKVEITIADNGNGISEKIKDKIFQPFFTTKPAGQGTGLGLSLSYDVIKAYKGEIEVATKEGEGATFTIVLPLAPIAAEA